MAGFRHSAPTRVEQGTVQSQDLDDRGPVTAAGSSRTHRRRAIVVIAVMAIVAMLAVLGVFVRHGSDTAPPGAGTAKAPAETNPYEAAYGTFQPVTTTGSRRTEISLPAGARTAGIVSWDSADTDFDAVLMTGLGTEVQLPGVGGSTGSAAYGLDPAESSGSDMAPESLTVLTDGPWTVTIAPVSSAAELPVGGTSGTGSRVYLYSGAPRRWVITYHPRPRLWDGVQVLQWQVGRVQTVPHVLTAGPDPYARSYLFRLDRGPSVVLIHAWRGWSISPT